MQSAPPPATLADPPRTPHDLRQLAVVAHRDPRTVAAAYRGDASDIVTAAVTAAATRLGFAPPPRRPRGT